MTDRRHRDVFLIGRPDRADPDDALDRDAGLLIADESTANLDALAEAEAYNALAELAEGLGPHG